MHLPRSDMLASEPLRDLKVRTLESSECHSALTSGTSVKRSMMHTCKGDLSTKLPWRIVLLARSIGEPLLWLFANPYPHFDPFLASSSEVQDQAPGICTLVSLALRSLPNQAVEL